MKSYIFRDNIENEIKKIIENKSVSKKLVCLYGIEKIGKTFTLEYVHKEMLKDSLVMFLPLNSNNISNPVFLKNSIFNLLKSENISNKKIFNLKEFLIESFKGITLTLPNIEYSLISVIEALEKNISDYESQIRNSMDKERLYIEKLSNITAHIAKNWRILYILIDDIHFADMQIWAFLDMLFLKNLNIGLFITYNRNCHYDERKKIDLLIKKFINMPTLNRELKEFKIDSIRQYLEQKIKQDKLDYFAEQIHIYTAGIPGYVSILTNDFDTLEKIKENQDFFTLMMQIYESLTEDERKVLRYLYLNKYEMHTEILELISEEERELDFDVIIENLLNKRGIIKESGHFYEIKLKGLIPDIPTLTRNRIYKKLYRIYQNSNLKSIDEYVYYINIIRLAKKAGDYKNYFELVVFGASYFINNYKYEIAIKIIEKALNCKESITDIKQKINIIIQYIEALFLSKQMKRLIEVYELLSYEEINYIYTNCSFLMLNIGRAYYYENQPLKAREAAKSVSESNETDTLIKTSILCSSFDLEGNYNEALRLYDNFIRDKNRDEQSHRVMDISIQMFENNFQECIMRIDKSINYFKEYSPKSLRTFRYLAAAYNNKGIELLMSRGDITAIESLNESYNLFKDYFPIEEHFPLNNIGLYHLLVTQNIDEALKLFEKAYSRAISPLQKSYICQNIAFAYILLNDWEKALIYIYKATEFTSICPDPIVKNYYAYNLAYINSKLEKPYDGICYLKKAQLELLNKKRSIMLNEHFIEKQLTDRRKFFSDIEFEPCELMFYN